MVVLQWVPRHSGIPENEKANAVAKNVAHKRGKKTNQWSLLIYIKAELQKARSAKLLTCHQSKSQKREATTQGFYVPSAKSSINPTLSEVLKRCVMQFY